MNREKLEAMVLNHIEIVNQLTEVENDLIFQGFGIDRDNQVFDFVNYDKIWEIAKDNMKDRVINEEDSELIDWLLEYYSIEEIKKECE